MKNEPNCYDIEDSGDILGLARSLVNGRNPGILSTVAQDGSPRIRWMSSLSFEDFPVFYSLTDPGSRKVGEIQKNPAVGWMFFNEDRSLILNITGRASIVTGNARLKQIWKTIADTSHAYFLGRYSAKPGFVVIETQAEIIECSSPKNDIRFQMDPAQLARTQHAPGRQEDRVLVPPENTR